MRDEKRSMFRVHRVILSALSKEFRDIFSTFSGNLGDGGKEIHCSVDLYQYYLYRCLVELGNSYKMLFFVDDGSRLHRMNIVRIEEDASLFQVCIYIMVNSLNIFNVNSGPAMLSTNH